ncbi:MAG: exonuclease SbcCD subunit D [Herbinix sp.]|nr:exonuclease SbcCD subunit D [Herbinix sp.]
MKLLHTSDLHIGKKVNEFPMIEDQKHILKQILNIVEEHKPQGVIIAGDIYDKGIPCVEGVTLFDWFLTELYKRKVSIFLVSGNHDSSERIHFGSRIMEENQIYIEGTFEGKLNKIALLDEYGPINFYLLPFVKPAMVKRYYPEVETYQEAVEVIIKDCQIDRSERNILVAHQFITNGNIIPEQCDSETISVGGLDNIDACVFDAFDYVALGHLHGAQHIARETIRYAGSPLKYSFSEARQIKSVTMIELGDKTKLEYSKIPLVPLQDMREIKGPIAALTNHKIYSQANTLDYIHAILTDDEEIYDAIGKLRSVYPNIMRLDFENSKSVWNSNAKLAAVDVKNRKSSELFEEFFENQNNITMSDSQKIIMLKLFEEVEGERN